MHLAAMCAFAPLRLGLHEARRLGGLRTTAKLTVTCSDGQNSRDFAYSLLLNQPLLRPSACRGMLQCSFALGF